MFSIMFSLVVLVFTLIGAGLASQNRFCKDEYSYSDCVYYRKNGFCETHPETLSKLCPKTCGLCSFGKVEENEQFCLDEDSPENCHFFKREGLCHKYENLMSEKCAKTCKLCESHKKCRDMQCSPSQTCLLDKNGTASCQCPRYCPYKEEYRKLGKVCASDGKTYKDVCHMIHHSCRENKNLSVAFYGMCHGDKPCEDGEAESKTGTCLAWKNLGLCEDKFYRDIMTKYCKKTCGLCPEKSEFLYSAWFVKGTTSGVPFPQRSCHSTPYGCCWDWKPRPAPGQGTCKKCRNRYPKLCEKHISLCDSTYGQNRAFMRENCPAACGYCGFEHTIKHEIRVYRGNGRTIYRLEQVVKKIPR